MVGRLGNFSLITAMVFYDLTETVCLRVFAVSKSLIAACSACHGTEGKGQNEIPRLAGQVYAYTVGQLTGWKTERGQGSAVDTSAIMAPTAHNLTRSQVEAVAAYVSYLQ
jgi:cytochrome c553